jgi:hypothetical protein
LADALHDAAMRLAVNEERVDDNAEIVDEGVAHDLDDAGIGIDLHFADVATVWESRGRPSLMF